MNHLFDTDAIDALVDEALADADVFAAPMRSGVDKFFRILRVRAGPRQPRGGRQLQAGPAVRGTDMRQQLWGSSDGVFLAGASQAQAEQWARQQAARFGGTVTPQEQHGAGRPHLHLVLPGDVRSGHIFYGQVPTGGVFFDYDY
ncbi:hypothetical protein [Lysobacter tyrosinilyticus]